MTLLRRLLAARSRLLWLALYAVLRALEFVVQWAKEAVEVKLKGTPREKPPGDESR